MAADMVGDADICAAWRSLRCLDAASVAVNAVRADTVLIGTGHQVAFIEFACGEAMARPETRRRDGAWLPIATAEAAGPRRPSPSRPGAIGRDRVIELLTLIQPRGRAVAPGWRAPPDLKELAALRNEAAANRGIDPVEPTPLARVRLSQLVMLVNLIRHAAHP